MTTSFKYARALCTTSAALSVIVLFLARVDDVIGHGGLVDPPMRSYAWNEGFDAPVNYDWNSLFCGGYHKFRESGGKCGLCGDAYDGPFDNDRGGVYDTGIIVRHYPTGLGEIAVKVELTAHHKGFFEFKLCPNNEHPLTKACLDRYPLVIREAQIHGDPYRYRPPHSPNLHELHVILPPDVTCDRCVLQWTYTAGNSAGVDSSGRNCIGCGLQETFVNCADISIGGVVDTIPVPRNITPASPQGEMVIPQRIDVMELIRNAPPDTPIREILAMIDRTRAGTGINNEQWTGSRSFPSRGGQVRETVQPVRPTRPAPRRATEAPPTRRVAQPMHTPVMRPSGVRRSDTGRNQRRRTTSRGRVPPTQAPRRSSPRRGRVPSSRGADMIGIGPPMQQQRPGPRDNSLLASMGRNVDELFGHTLRPLTPEPFRPSGRARPIPRHTFTRQRSPLVQAGLNIFGDTSRDIRPTIASVVERVPHGAQWRRGDGMISHRNAVRHASTFGQRDNMPQNVLQQHVPDLPLDILPRRDLDPMQRRRATALGENWFPESRRSRHSKRTQARQEAPTRTQSSSTRRNRIPRRIVVHSMAIAQNLLRSYPQLKGRVFLSPEAHARNTLYHMSQKYRRRQRWH